MHIAYANIFVNHLLVQRESDVSLGVCSVYHDPATAHGSSCSTTFFILPTVVTAKINSKWRTLHFSNVVDKV